MLYTLDEDNKKTSENIISTGGDIIAGKRFQGVYADKWYFYDYDLRGSVTAILGPDGAYTAGYQYDAFGNTTQKGDSDFKNEMEFTGCIADKSSGLYYMNSRYYNPSTGRFLTQDAMGGDAWTNNLYAYCGNNPVNFIDPTGYIPSWARGDAYTDTGTGVKPKPISEPEPDYTPPEKKVLPTPFRNSLPEQYPVELHWSDYVVFNAGHGDSRNINPELLARIAYMAKMEGIVWYVGSGYRTFSKQASYTGDRAAKEGISWHNYGLAVDVKGNKNTVFPSLGKTLYNIPRGRLKDDGFFEKYGLCREAVQNGWEPWHITPIECYPKNLKTGKRGNQAFDMIVRMNFAYNDTYYMGITEGWPNNWPDYIYKENYKPFKQ